MQNAEHHIVKRFQILTGQDCLFERQHKIAFPLVRRAGERVPRAAEGIKEGDTKKLGAVQIVEHAASGKGQKQAAQDRCDLRAVVIQPFQKRRAAVRLLRLLLRVAVQRLIIRGKRAV